MLHVFPLFLLGVQVRIINNRIDIFPGLDVI